MRHSVARIAFALVIVVPFLPGSPAAADPKADLAAGVRRQLAAGLQVVPKQAVGTAAAAQPSTANPYTALLPDPGAVDQSYWQQVAKTQSAKRAKQQAAARQNAAAASPLVHDEAEPSGFFGANDSHATAELVKGFGTGAGKNNRARVLGQLSPEAVSVEAVGPFDEDNGSIPLAADPGVADQRNGAQTSGEVGDGPFGSAGTGSGDFDFLKVNATAGQQIVADIDTPTGDLDSVLVLYDSTGEILAANDDSGGSLDSLLRFQFTTAGTYYLMVSAFGFGTILPADPFDSASGVGVGSEGPYGLTVTVAQPDLDVFALDLAAGDVLGASVTGAGTRLVVRDQTGREVFGSEQDASFIYSPSAPLPGGGNAVVDHVAARAGRYSVEVSGAAGGYDATVEAYRPGPEATAAGTTQTLFLDFDGQRVNTSIFGGPGVRDLSPLAGFLGRWGLTAADEDAVIDAVIASIRENIVTDLRARGADPRFGLRILNSRDNADPFGQPNVHRLVIGGTIEESGVDTIGIAQYIDPGNYSTEDTALILLDVLSDPAGAHAATLNGYLTPDSNKIEFIGRAVGNVASHEAGHLYGNWHTDPINDVPNLMDAGGSFPGLFGVGPDGVGGTADDVDYDFGDDTLYPQEGFTGTEDTLNTSAWALTKGRTR